MTPRSLRLRLLLGAIVAIGVALGLAWLAMTVLFQRHIERRLEIELAQHAVPLIAGLSLPASGPPALSAEPADPRFATPASGLYWQVTAPGRSLRSRSLWDAALPIPRSTDPDGWHMREASGPFGQRVLLSERLIRPDRAGPAVLVQVAADAGALAGPRREFGRELALFLLLLGIVLSVAAWVQVALGLRPLGRVQAEIDRLRRDPHARFTGRYPREIAPLTSAIDTLAAAREADLLRARRRAADLAHGMKTPLAALAAQSRRARAAGAVDAADGLDRAIAAVSAAVEAELRRSRASLVAGTSHVTAVRPVAERLVAVIQRLEEDGRVRLEVTLSASRQAPLAAEELTELLGPLIENAARHARTLVRIADDDTGFRIDDDGPGIAHDRAGEATLRGRRLDEGGGDGLGLAIALDIAEASGGTLMLERSPLGGLAARVGWKGGAGSV